MRAIRRLLKKLINEYDGPLKDNPCRIKLVPIKLSFDDFMAIKAKMGELFENEESSLYYNPMFVELTYAPTWDRGSFQTNPEIEEFIAENNYGDYIHVETVITVVD